MIDVYSPRMLLEEGKIESCEKGVSYFNKYFAPENKVLIFPTLEEAKKFGAGFGSYILQKDGPIALQNLGVTKTSPLSDIDTALSKITGAAREEAGETWLIFKPDAFSKLEEYMAERKIEYQTNE